MVNEEIVSPRQEWGGGDASVCVLGSPGAILSLMRYITILEPKPQTRPQLGPLGEQVGKTEKWLYSADGTSTGA